MPAELTARAPQAVSAHKVVIGFIAGFLAVLVFHQPVLAVLVSMGISKATVYSTQATAPLGVPQILSIAFWGGAWGVLFALIETRLPRGAAYWISAFLFGAIFPTLVAWFAVAPLKGQPVAGGWQAASMLTGPIINGAWGLGTAIMLVLGTGLTRRARASWSAIRAIAPPLLRQARKPACRRRPRRNNARRRDNRRTAR